MSATPPRIQYGGTAANADALTAAAASKVSDALDYEAVAPGVALTAGGDRIYLSHCPVLVFLTHGIRINVPTPGSGSITLQVYAGGLPVFPAPVTVTGETTLFPPAAILPARRSIPAGAKLEVLVLSITGAGYSVWRGLRVAFLLRDPDDSVTMEALEVLSDEIAAAQQDADLALGSLQELKAGGVILRRNGYDAQFYPPATDSGAGRMAALRAALEDASLTPDLAATVELQHGGFTVADNATLSTFAPHGNVTIVFGEQSWLDYADPEDSALDYGFFTSPLSLVNFGLREKNPDGSAFDNWKALQSCMNAAPPRPDGILMDSGRKVKDGATLLFPRGLYRTSRTWWISPTTSVLGTSGGSLYSSLSLFAGTYNNPGDPLEHFTVAMEEGAISHNNCFGAHWQGVNIVQTEGLSANVRASGLYWYGGQNTFISDCVISGHGLDGVRNDGASFGGTVWVSDNGRRGINWLTGGTAGYLSVEHNNRTLQVDPDTGVLYPQIEITGGAFDIAGVGLEEAGGGVTSMLGVHVRASLSCSIGGIVMQPNAGLTRSHTMLRCTGPAYNVWVGGIICFYANAQTLVHDEGYGSPLGVGVPYTITGSRAMYDQYSAGLPGSRVLSNNWTGLTNDFAKNVNVGDPTGTGFGLTVRSSAGNVVLVAGYTLMDNGARVAGLDVLGARKAAVANAVAAAAAPTQAEFNALVSLFNTLLSRLRATGGHGLISD